MGNIGSKTWTSFGAELSDLDKLTAVDKTDWVSKHRNLVVNAIVKEYVNHKLVEILKRDEDLKGIWLRTVQTGSWVFDTKIREADEFDFMLVMDNVPGVPTPINPAKDLFSLEILRRRLAGTGLVSSNRETGETENHPVNIGLVEGINMGPKYISEYTTFPSEKIRMLIYNLIEKFTYNNPNEGPWLSRLSDIYLDSISMKVVKNKRNKIPVCFNVTWMDSVLNKLHEVSINLIPVYRNINKTLGEFWTPPTYFDNEDSVFGQLKVSISRTALVVAFDPSRKGWTLFYHYADQIVYNHLRQWQPGSLMAFRLLKALRDATLPWTCISDPATSAVLGVEQLISSQVLQNMFFHELVQEPDVSDWAKDKLYYRMVGMLKKLNGLVGFNQEFWGSQSNIYNPGQSKPLDKPLPVSADIMQLISLLSLRSQQYQKGSVSINKECHTPTVGQGQSENLDNDIVEISNEEKCINTWNHHYFIQFKKPTPDSHCKQPLYSDIASAGGMFPVVAPVKKKVRMFQECSPTNLDRYLPGGKARLMVVSWNTHETGTLPQALPQLIHTGHQHDVYVIGTQETNTNRKEWETEILSLLGDKYSVFFSGNHWALSLIIVMKNDLLPFAAELENDNVTVSPQIRWYSRTKGAIAACFKLFGTRLIFINAHLTARDGMMKKRTDDYHEICQKLELPRDKTNKGKDLYSHFDCVFWLGDLNFRMSGGKKKWRKTNVNVDEMLEKYDELQVMQREGKAFRNFKEGKIRFPPTFRYDPGTTAIHLKREMENPSFTDRILYKCKEQQDVKCLHYDMAMEVLESDHKPIQGVFQVSIRVDKNQEEACPPRERSGMARVNHSPRTPRRVQQPAVEYGVPGIPYVMRPGHVVDPARVGYNVRAVPPPAIQAVYVAGQENIPMHTQSVPSINGRVHNKVHIVDAPQPYTVTPPALKLPVTGIKAVFAPGNPAYTQPSNEFSWKTLPQDRNRFK